MIPRRQSPPRAARSNPLGPLTRWPAGGSALGASGDGFALANLTDTLQQQLGAFE